MVIKMMIHMSDLSKQDIIDIQTGCKVGKLCDFCVDTSTAMITNLIVIRKSSFFSFIRGGEEIIIPWCDVHMFGRDTILITKCPQLNKRKKSGNLFSEIIAMFK